MRIESQVIGHTRMTAYWNFSEDRVQVSICEDQTDATSNFLNFLDRHVTIVPCVTVPWDILNELSDDIAVCSAQIVTMHHEGKLT